MHIEFDNLIMWVNWHQESDAECLPNNVREDIVNKLDLVLVGEGSWHIDYAITLEVRKDGIYHKGIKLESNGEQS